MDRTGLQQLSIIIFLLQAEERDSKDSYLSEMEAEIIEEMHVAQKKYNALTNMKHAPKLCKPSIYIPCNFELPTEEVVEVPESAQPEDSNRDLNVSIEVTLTTECGRNKCECTIQINNDPKEDPIDCLCIDNVQTQIGTQASIASESQISEKDSSESIPKENREECKPETSTSKRKSNESKNEALNIELPKLQFDNLVTVKETVPSECECRAEVQKTIETSVCRCDKCMEMRRMRQRALYIIASTRQNMEDEQMLPVIGGVKPQWSCKCLQNYENLINKHEELKLRKRALDELLSMRKRYIIGGVVARPDGKPIFILNGVVPVKECPCVRRRQEQLKEQERLANMPKPLPGGITCIISGVKETPEGNVYVISGVLPRKKCNCEVLYEQFEKEHKHCMALYDRYSQKVQKNIDEYMKDISADERYHNAQVCVRIIEYTLFE